MNTSMSRRGFLKTSAVFACPGLLAAADGTSLELSTFVEDVTPPLGHPCMGGGIDPVRSIADRLSARGFILQGAGKPIVLVAVDWCEIRNDAYDRWRTAIARSVGTDRERVMVTALHQHDAPIADLEAQRLLNAHESFGAICNLGFHERTVRKVAQAAKASLAMTRRVTHVGTGKAKVEKVASNRRYADRNGKVHYNRMSRTTDPAVRDAEEGTIDPFVRTLSFWNGDKPLLALHAYATHPMSYYGSGEVSADFVGLAREKMHAANPETFQMYISGCSGNVTAGKYNDGARLHRQSLADRLFKAMKESFKESQNRPISRVEFRSVPLYLEARSGKAFTEQELTRRLDEEPRDARGFGQCLAALGLSWRKRVAARQPIDVPVLDFGNAALLLLPAESYVEFQLFAQQVRPDDFILVAGYGECGPGYIPIERAWDENDGNLSDWCWIDPGSEKRMKEVIEKALNK